MKIKKLLFALLAKSVVIDFITADRTYQVSGDPRFSGMFERYFHRDEHPTRREVGEAEMQSVLDSVTEIRLWVEPQKFRIVTQAELEVELAPFPIK